MAGGFSTLPLCFRIPKGLSEMVFAKSEERKKRKASEVVDDGEEGERVCRGGSTSVLQGLSGTVPCRHMAFLPHRLLGIQIMLQLGSCTFLRMVLAVQET